MLAATCTALVSSPTIFSFFFLGLKNEWVTDDKILGWSKLKQIADEILKCISNEK